ncbi:MAG TPA: dihydrofolate reductase family protein [Ktedonobacterales bacterium]|nr:dihydrofolate reductase family protein [Ktedonobacterales bacterium]
MTDLSCRNAGVRLARKDSGQSNSAPNLPGHPAWIVLGRVSVRSGRLAWPEEAPYHTPVFVVTHTKRDPWERPGGTTFQFVNDGIESALLQAREAAGDRDVRIASGAETIQEYRDSGLIDEFSITLAPVLFGTGIRLFDRVDPARLALNQARTDASSRVTHLTYTAVKR